MSRIMKLVMLGLLLSLAGPLSAGESAENVTEPASIEIRGDTVVASQAWTLIEEGALIIDVRSPEEFESGHLGAATNIPHTQISELAAAIGPDKSRPVVVYCRSGGRAGTAQKQLEELGYTAVFNGTGLTALQATQP